MIFIKNTRRVLQPSGGFIYKALYKCPECNEEIEYTKYNLKGKPEDYPCIKCSKISGNTKHGLRHNPAYKQWKRAKTRCNNKNNPSYNNYGGRGIKMYKPWENNPKKYVDYISSLPNAFYDGLSIDRVHNDFGYEPMNLKWSTQSEQTNNQRIGNIGEIKYIGITEDKNRKDKKYFKTMICVNLEKIYLGNFSTIKKAVDIRNKYIDNNNLNNRKNQYAN